MSERPASGMALPHEQLVAVVRIAIGFVFLWASLSKLSSIEAWAASLPEVLTGNHASGFARAIVGLELALGIAFVTGFAPRATSLVAIATLLAFSSYLAAREVVPGLQSAAGCGCFGVPHPASDSPGALWPPLLRNAAMLFGCAWIATRTVPKPQSEDESASRAPG